MNQPVTFHKRVKSSGYGVVQPKITLGRPPPAPVRVNPKPSVGNGLGRNLLSDRCYPADSDPPLHHQPQHAMPGNAPLHAGAICRLAFSTDASRLLTASADKTARTLRLPFGRRPGEGANFVAHNAPLYAASWSHDGNLVLTAAADRTARMWHVGSASTLLEFSHTQAQLSKLSALNAAPGAAAKQSSAASAAGPAFTHDIRAAQFFHLDQFVLLASGNKLHLYRYKLAEVGSSACGGNACADALA